MYKQDIKINGFTIVELIIAGAISISVIGIGFSVLQIALKGNKIDETSMGLGGRLSDTLDFILDEVKVGKRIIDDESDLSSNCIYPSDSEFLFAITLPDQALSKADYETEGSNLTLNQVDCPIVYSLRASNFNEKMPYALLRYGPQYDEKGYYISPSFIDFQETVLLDGISASFENDKMNCPENGNWNETTIKGINLCVDKYKKYLEIQIEAQDFRKGINNKSKSLASIGAFSSIQDETQVSLFSPTLGTDIEDQICTWGGCCLMGQCLNSDKIAYMIDRSFLMNEDYQGHPNGLIINGQWIDIDNPEYITASINGKSLFSFTKDSLIQQINTLAASGGKKITLQMITFNEPAGTSEYLFDEPTKLTLDNRNTVIKWLDERSTDQGNEEQNQQNMIDPWYDLCKILKSNDIEQVVLITASTPNRIEASSQHPCVEEEEGYYYEIIEDYNRISRSKKPVGSLIINSISLYHNFCEANKNYNENNWLGLLSSGAESSCTHIK